MNKNAYSSSNKKMALFECWNNTNSQSLNCQSTLMRFCVVKWGLRIMSHYTDPLREPQPGACNINSGHKDGQKWKKRDGGKSLRKGRWMNISKGVWKGWAGRDEKYMSWGFKILYLTSDGAVSVWSSIPGLSPSIYFTNCTAVWLFVRVKSWRVHLHDALVWVPPLYKSEQSKKYPTILN